MLVIVLIFLLGGKNWGLTPVNGVLLALGLLALIFSVSSKGRKTPLYAEVSGAFALASAYVPFCYQWWPPHATPPIGVVLATAIGISATVFQTALDYKNTKKASVGTVTAVVGPLVLLVLLLL